ncbi:MAG: signal peptidase II [Clostridia bacterium]|nr:signal peptidase II [Clostridia bacterium]
MIRRTLGAAAVIAAVILLDRVTKAVVAAHMALYEEVPVLPGFIRFYRTENTGAAFSMLKDHPWVLMVFTLIAMGVVGFLLFRFLKRHPLLTVSLSMILGGGISNLIDRIAYGKVLDFIDFDFKFFGFFRFAVFNVADIFVTCGAVCLAVYIIAFEPKVEKRLRAQKAAEQAETAETAEPTADPDGIPEENPCLDPSDTPAEPLKEAPEAGPEAPDSAENT